MDPVGLQLRFLNSAYLLLCKMWFGLNIESCISLRAPEGPEADGDGIFIQYLLLPFPATEVHNQKPTVFICIDVMEEVEGRGSVFIIKVLSSLFVSDMKPNLEK